MQIIKLILPLLIINYELELTLSGMNEDIGDILYKNIINSIASVKKEMNNLIVNKVYKYNNIG